MRLKDAAIFGRSTLGKTDRHPRRHGRIAVRPVLGGLHHRADLICSTDSPRRRLFLHHAGRRGGYADFDLFLFMVAYLQQHAMWNSRTINQ